MGKLSNKPTPFEEALFERVARTGDLSPGNLSFTADIVEMCEHELILHDIEPCCYLGDAADYLRTKAREAENIEQPKE